MLLGRIAWTQTAHRQSLLVPWTCSMIRSKHLICPLDWLRQGSKHFAMPNVHITWLIKAECNCRKVTSIYEPVARAQHSHPGSSAYLHAAGCFLTWSLLTVAGLHAFQLAGYCIARSRCHLKMASPRRSCYSTSPYPKNLASQQQNHGSWATVLS